MLLYYGSNIIVKNVDFNKSRLRIDFGRGFYLSNQLGTARQWTFGKAGFSGTPIVMRYEINDT
jgi:hypothetical protein